MRIMRVLGLGLLIIVLQLLVPRMFGALENSLVAFFQTTQTVFEVSQASVASSTLKLPLTTH